VNSLPAGQRAYVIDTLIKRVVCGLLDDAGETLSRLDRRACRIMLSVVRSRGTSSFSSNVSRLKKLQEDDRLNNRGLRWTVYTMISTIRFNYLHFCEYDCDDIRHAVAENFDTGRRMLEYVYRHRSEI
jgi:hypothetical protein